MQAQTPSSPEVAAAPRGFRDDAAFFLIFAAWALFFFSRDFSAGIPKIDDGAQYLLIAKGFAHGLGYENLAFPGIPAFVHLPSAFPLLLTPYWWFLAPHDSVLRILLAILMAGGAWFAFLWLRTFLPRGQAFLAILAAMANIQFVILSTSVMSEVPTVFFTYAGLWCYHKDERSGRRGIYGWLALLAWLILFRLRINTAPFFLLYVGTLAYRRDFRKAGTGAALAALWLCLETYWGRRLPDNGGYVQYGLVRDYAMNSHPMLSTWMAVVSNYFKHLYSYVGSVFGSELLPFFYYLRPMDRAKRLIVLFLSAWCLLGLAVFWRKHPRYRLAAAAFVLQWAPIFIYWRTLNRYMMPSLPFLIACMALGAAWVLERIKPSRPAVAACAVWCFLSVVTLNEALFSSTFHTRWDVWTEERGTYQRIHAFIRAADPRPDMVISIHNYYTFLATGVPSPDWEYQWEFVRAHGLAQGKRVWAFFIVPGEGRERDVRLGEGYCLGGKPLYRADAYHSLYELAPCASSAPPLRDSQGQDKMRP